MTIRTLVVAPHPDDETLGAGGTLLRRKAEGATVAWLIVTGITVGAGWYEDQVNQRAREIERVTRLYDFDDVFQLNFPSIQLDNIPLSELVVAISNVFKAFEPEEVFVPHAADVHSDHRVVFDAVSSCAKWFRHPSVKRVLAYETLSETDFVLRSDQSFRPNLFVNIKDFLEKKQQILDIYASELGKFPFPRSKEAIHALATVRGAASGFDAAEAFELLRERT